MKITKLLIIGVGVLMFVGSSACSSPGLPGTSAPSATPLPAETSAFVPAPSSKAATKSGTIRTSTPFRLVRDVPTWIAIDLLRSQGYTIAATEFAQFDLVPAALAKGDLDIVSTSNTAVWAAIGKGAAIRTIVGQNGNPYLLAATQEIQSCKDLADKRVALPGATGLVPMMLDLYIAQNCPSTKPQMIVAPQNREVALLAGQVDAANIELGNWVQVEVQAPGRFHPLVIYDNQFPRLQVTSFHVRQEYAAKNPELVKDYVRAVVTANRQVQDPQVLGDAIVRYIGLDKAVAEKAVKVFMEQKVWDVNGALTQESVQNTIDFMIKAGSLPAGTRAQDVSDLSYLNAVLGEIGKK